MYQHVLWFVTQCQHDVVQYSITRLCALQQFLFPEHMHLIFVFSDHARTTLWSRLTVDEVTIDNLEWKCNETVCLSTRHVTVNIIVRCTYTYTSWQSYLNCGMKIMPRENFICTNVISVPLQYHQGSCANLKWGNHSLYNINSFHWRVRSVITNF
jgi:hypothetical protein